MLAVEGGKEFKCNKKKRSNIEETFLCGVQEKV